MGEKAVRETNGEFTATHVTFHNGNISQIGKIDYCLYIIIYKIYYI